MRSHYCGVVTESLLGQSVTLCGWVNTRRDHGGVIFIDLRDREGLVQIVIDPDTAQAFANAEKARNEYVLQIQGIVRSRPAGTENTHLRSGKIEVLVKECHILNRAEPLPFQLSEDNLSEEVRLTYRYLDLRRQEMQQRLILRSKIVRAIRHFMDDEGFLDIETPMLTKATPEGARDYLVPSRTHPGEFFALPQSPQLFKQLLMMSGFDRYYQIVRCFRDEDLRADRQPEFTQLDVETSFLTQDQVIDIAQRMVKQLFNNAIGVNFTDIPHLTYSEAMQRFGSDKPDLRIPLEFTELTDVMQSVEFKVFNEAANRPNGRVVALKIPQGGEKLSRKEIDDLTNFVSRYGAKGLAYIKVNELEKGAEGLQSPIVKFLNEATLTTILERCAAQNGDLIFFGADKAKIVNDSMGALRVKLGHDLNLYTCEWAPLWVVDFPMFEFDEEDKRYVAVHHPFTAPKNGLEDLRNPEKALAKAYDFVLNGTEIGGGSVRIYQPEIQSQVFELLGISQEEAQEKFGFLLNALKFGAPPHAGIAFGLDRLVMLMTGAKSIRDVMAFPKTQSAACLLTDAPAPVGEKQLRELNIRLRKTTETPAV